MLQRSRLDEVICATWLFRLRLRYGPFTSGSQRQSTASWQGLRMGKLGWRVTRWRARLSMAWKSSFYTRQLFKTVMWYRWYLSRKGHRSPFTLAFLPFLQTMSVMLLIGKTVFFSIVFSIFVYMFANFCLAFNFTVFYVCMCLFSFLLFILSVGDGERLVGVWQ